MSKLNERVRNIADQVKSSTVFSNDFLSLGTEDSSHATIKMKDVNFKIGGDIYEKNLPEGITLETIKNLKDYDSDFEAGVLLGVGESTLQLMDKDEKVLCSTAHINAGSEKEISTYIGIHDDKYESMINGSIFVFQSHVKDKICEDRVITELSQKQLVRKHLVELYTHALCETTK